ncbi:MAG: sigma-70 family RNA polymerase sigma factor [Hyphomicrobium sp.]
MPPTPQHLADLIGRVAQRDRAAFAEVYRATSAKLLGIITRIVNRRDIAEEILQEVYVTVWERARDFDRARASPITWLATIARNRALDSVRRRQMLSIEDTPAALDAPTGDPHPLDGLELSEDLARLWRCIDSLESERREVVILAYIEGESREALGRRFGRPVPTIKTWLHRSLKQLKECLGT